MPKAKKKITAKKLTGVKTLRAKPTPRAINTLRGTGTN